MLISTLFVIEGIEWAETSIEGKVSMALRILFSFTPLATVKSWMVVIQFDPTRYHCPSVEQLDRFRTLLNDAT